MVLQLDRRRGEDRLHFSEFVLVARDEVELSRRHGCSFVLGDEILRDFRLSVEVLRIWSVARAGWKFLWEVKWCKVVGEDVTAVRATERMFGDGHRDIH